MQREEVFFFDLARDNFTHQKRYSTGGGGGLPVNNYDVAGGGRNRGFPGMPRGRQMHKWISRNASWISPNSRWQKITILCGLVTNLVLHGIIGVVNLESSEAQAINQNLIEETNRILAEIRSYSDPTDPDEPEFNPNVTYTLGPKFRIGISSERLHGIENIYNMAHLDNKLAGYWAELPLIIRLMFSHTELKWIWWMDSDVFFTDMVFEIPLSKYDKHNLAIHGYPDLLFEQKSWIALNTGSFMFRNCRWPLDLLDAWQPMGPKGPIRDEAEKVLTANLKGRPTFEVDDQSTLIYLYEKMMKKYHPGLGEERWPVVTHFAGCKRCGSYGDYSVDRCLHSMQRAFNFADNQVLKLYRFRHRGLLGPNIKRIRDDTTSPLEIVDQLDIRHSLNGKTESNS
ncbi:putative glycosyltransferase 3 [Hibiscus syriacus]|uniref:Glycosyltransferase 3 n=1 Tax=Hibiscus syriacus TaxID=106335 RepID=A0A6A2XU72_HIBSY|nr:putative glycosyltransferase 3 [Hibiscus syriacus]